MNAKRKPFVCEWEETVECYMLDLFNECAPEGHGEVHLAFGEYELKKLIKVCERAIAKKHKKEMTPTDKRREAAEEYAQKFLIAVPMNDSEERMNQVILEAMVQHFEAGCEYEAEETEAWEFQRAVELLKNDGWSGCRRLFGEMEMKCSKIQCANCHRNIYCPNVIEDFATAAVKELSRVSKEAEARGFQRAIDLIKTGWPTDEDGSPSLYAPGDMPGPFTWAEWLEKQK